MASELNEQQKQVMAMLLTVMGEASRTPVLRRPNDYGMAYEDVFFPALDGTVVEGWFIPADSDRVIIFNHYEGANRHGFPGHLEPWSLGGAGFEGRGGLTRGSGHCAASPRPSKGLSLASGSSWIGACPRRLKDAWVSCNPDVVEGTR